MAYGDVTLLTSGGSLTNSQTVTTASVTITSGAPAYLFIAGRLTGGISGAPSLTSVPSGVSQSLLADIDQFTDRVSFLWQLTGAGTDTIVATLNGSDTFDYYSYLLVSFDSTNATLAHNVVEASVSGVAAISASYSPSTATSDIAVAFYSRIVAASPTTTLQSGWTDDDTAGPTQMRDTQAATTITTECHWDTGASQSTANTTWSDTAGQGHEFAFALDEAAGGTTTVTLPVASFTMDAGTGLGSTHVLPVASFTMAGQAMSRTKTLEGASVTFQPQALTVTGGASNTTTSRRDTRRRYGGLIRG